MGVLMAVPNSEGVELLKKEFFEKITKFALADENGEIYFTDTVHSIYFDSDGVLTVSALIPKEEHFTVWNKWVKLLSDEDKVIADIETPAIQFVKGVGGEQTVKLTVGGKAGEVVFKKDEYLTLGELNGLYISTIKALTTKVFQLENKLIKKGIFDV
jgi:hypothetical protein